MTQPHTFSIPNVVIIILEVLGLHNVIYAASYVETYIGLQQLGDLHSDKTSENIKNL